MSLPTDNMEFFIFWYVVLSKMYLIFQRLQIKKKIKKIKKIKNIKNIKNIKKRFFSLMAHPFTSLLIAMPLTLLRAGEGGQFDPLPSGFFLT